MKREIRVLLRFLETASFPKIYKTFLKNSDLCKELAKVGLLYFSHSQGKQDFLKICKELAKITLI